MLQPCYFLGVRFPGMYTTIDRRPVFKLHLAAAVNGLCVIGLSYNVGCINS